LIIDFGHEKLKKSEYSPFGDLPDTAEVSSWLRSNRVVIRIARHAGGHPAGARGVLEQIGSAHPLAKLYENGRRRFPNGLQCFPLP
jgi:hypothetical protein